MLREYIMFGSFSAHLSFSALFSVGCSFFAEFHQMTAGEFSEMCRKSSGIGRPRKHRHSAHPRKKQNGYISLYLRERDVSPEKARMWKNVFLEIKQAEHLFFVLRWHALSAAKILMVGTHFVGARTIRQALVDGSVLRSSTPKHLYRFPPHTLHY